ncbi:MAG: YdbH domain-containing protein [Alphaproteobacteria bacterium]
MTADGTAPRGRRRWRRWALLGIAVALILAWFNAPWIVERLVVARLATAGAGPVALDVRRVGPFETLIEGLRLGSDTTLAAERAIVRYTPLAVFRGEIYSVTLEGLAVAGPVADAAATAARVEGWLRTGTGVRVAHVEFGEAKATVESPGGNWNATLRGHLSQAASGALDGSVSVVATSVAGAFGGELRLKPDDSGRTTARLAVREGILRLPGLTLESMTGEIAVARGAGPLPDVEIDIQAGGKAAGGGGIERGRLRVLVEGGTAGASLAGIDLDGRRLTVETAFDVTSDADGVALRPSRPGSISFLDRPVRGAMPLALDARIMPGGAPALRLVRDGAGTRVIHTLRIELRPTTLPTAFGPARLQGGLLAIDGTIGEGSARGAATLAGLTMALPDRRIAAEDVSLVLRWEEMPPRLEIAARQVRSTASPALFAPFALRVAGAPAAGGTTLAGRGTGERFTFDLDGTAARDGSGAARVRLRPVDLAGGGLAGLSPAAAAVARDASGTLAARGELRWSAAGADGSGRVLLRDVSAALPFARVGRVDGVVALESLAPPTTSGVQRLSVGVVDAGLPLTGGTIAFRLDGGRPSLESARFQMAGGLVTLTEATLSPAFDVALLRLEAAGLDAGIIARDAGVDGLAAEGRISGSLPIEIRGGTASFAGGMLAGTGAGRLALRQAGGPPAFRSDTAGETAGDTGLDGAPWADLRLAIERDAGGRMLGRVSAAGRPQVAFDLEGRLDRLVRRALDRYRAPPEIERSIGEYGDP